MGRTVHTAGGLGDGGLRDQGHMRARWATMCSPVAPVPTGPRYFLKTFPSQTVSESLQALPPASAQRLLRSVQGVPSAPRAVTAQLR